MRKIVVFMSVLVICIAAILIYKSNMNQVDTEYKDTQYVLGTVATITVYENGADEVLKLMFDRLKEIETRMTTKTETSEVSQINQNAGIKAVQVSEDTFYVVKKALEYAKLSDGKFDITLGPVIDLWGIGTDAAKIPSEDALSNALALVDYTQVELDEVNLTIFLRNKGMKIDLGGIAKGYAADEMVRIAAENDIKKAMINLGGNVYAYGEKEEGAPWKVGIQTPFDDRNTYFGIISATNLTIVTSGPYERYFEENGIVYHHILNNATGYPVDNNIASVTIIGEKSIDADALSTILFSLGVDEGLKLMNSLEYSECIYVTKDSKIYLSDGIREKFVLADNSFDIIE